MQRNGLTPARAVAFLLGLLPGLAAIEARAQELQDDYRYRRLFLGFGVALALPQGEFETYVDPSFGLSAFLLYNFDRSGQFGLRLDGSYIHYGRETVRRPLSQTIQRVLVDVTTDNEIFSLQVGPQLTLHAGALRPYLNVAAGFSYFATRSSVSGSDDFDDFASSTNFDDFTFAWTSGGGLWVGVSRRVSLLFSGQYVRNGRVRYLREGSIREAPDGSISFTPIESTANLLVLQFGVSVSVGAESEDRDEH